MIQVTSVGSRRGRQIRYRCYHHLETGKVVGTVVLLLALSGCTGSPQAAPPTMDVPTPATVAEAMRKSVPLELRAIGRVEPKETVAVKARVSGQITGIAFEEGQDVKANQVLFTIDSRAQASALSQAQAHLIRDQANLKNAQADLARAQKLIERNTISREVFDKAQANVDALIGTVQADRAAIQAAEVQLDYCTIRSPINGRAGDLHVRFGNVVKGDDSDALVVINQISPIYVSFTVAEQELARIRQYHREAEQAGQSLLVTAIPAGGTPQKGSLVVIDNQVDPQTGTIELKGLFANQDRQLWPGQYADVVLRLAMLTDAIVIPNEAIQTGQQGEYVFVVLPGNTIEMRPIVKGVQVGGATVVEKGIKPGERVVTDGQLRLKPGAKVQIKSPAAGQKGKGA